MYVNKVERMKIRKRSNFLSFDAVYFPPGDKSISHRSIFFSALCENKIQIENFLFSDDCLKTIQAFQNLGVNIEWNEEGPLTLQGVGLDGLKAPARPLYLGNSGTTARLLLGLLSAQNFESLLEGDSSLSSRPMKRVTYPLRLMGAKIEGREDANYLPIRIKGGRLKGIEYALPVASAQVKSALLLAGMYAEGKTAVIEKYKSRDHSERFLRAFGADIYVEGLRVEIRPGRQISGRNLFVPGDISSAAYFIALSLLAKDSRLVVKDVGLNPTRLGFIRAIEKMGASLEIVCKVAEEESAIFEPYGDIIVESSRLKGIEIKREEIPSLIDELPILFLLASLSKGETHIQGASELRVKETDRINSMLVNLRRMGVRMETEGDDIFIEGREELKPAALESFSDHRTAMVMTIAGIFAQGESTLDEVECIRISYPNFLQDLEKILGSRVEFEN